MPSVAHENHCRASLLHETIKQWIAKGGNGLVDILVPATCGQEGSCRTTCPNQDSQQIPSSLLVPWRIVYFLLGVARETLCAAELRRQTYSIDSGADLAILLLSDAVDGGPMHNPSLVY
jgi:hypothetical protein